MIRNPACDRAHAWVSREVDGELNELARLALRRHLDRCSECSQYAASVEVFTTMLRGSGLERYTCDLRAFHRRRRPSARRLVPSVAACALVAGLTGVAVSHELGSSRNRSPDRYSTYFPTVATPTPPPGEDRRVSVRQPMRLPIGQRSAADDFRQPL